MVERRPSPLSGLWPLFALVIETPRLVLQLPCEADLVALARAARAIQPAGETPFQLPWLYAPSPDVERALLQRHWRALAHWRPDSWHLLLAIYLDGEPIGVQEMWATEYGVTRSAGVGTWLALAHQRHGLGREALAGARALAFDWLGADEIHAEYLDGNLAAEAVCDRLGLGPNGQRIVTRDGAARLEHRRRLTRAAWSTLPARPTIAVRGFDGCASLLGV
jgi:RimJ/RimL family protein N-acetyltransferase